MLQLTIKQVVQETPEAITLVFELPSPGWDYLPGQFITLKVWVEGQYVQRSYSFCTTSYSDRYPAITVKKIKGGLLSGYLHTHARKGMVIDALPPTGRFILPPRRAAEGRHLVLIAGGSGITPLFSILKSALIQEQGTTVSLLYANRDEKNTIYRDALEVLVKNYPTRLQVTHILSKPSASWQGYRGRMNPALLRSLLGQLSETPAKDYFLSAPKGLMEMAQATLQQLGVPHRHIHQEHFTLSPSTTVSKSFTYELKIDYLGREHTCYPSSEQTLLEASLQAGVEIPYACMTGTCNTCRAQCVEGCVKMDEDEGLSEEELEEGYVLTCVAHPTTKKVKIKV